MKGLAFLLLTWLSAFGQDPGRAKWITFNRADAEHCSIVKVEGVPMLRMVYGGTSVAVGSLVRTSDRDFRIFAVIRQIGPAKAQVRPKEFYALYSDPAHTRFSFYDKAAEVEQRIAGQTARNQGGAVASSQGEPGTQGAPPVPGPNEQRPIGDRLCLPCYRDTTAQEEAQARQSDPLPGAALTPDELYLRRRTLHKGDSAEGFVYFRKPKRSKLDGGSQNMLFEIDIPVNGVVFRFR